MCIANILTKEALSIMSFIISVISLCITIYKFYLEKPRLIFHDSDISGFYKYSNKFEYNYLDSHCIAFAHVKISNKSVYACNISEFKLRVEGFKETTCHSGTAIRDDYTVSDSPEMHIPKSNIIELPVRIEAYGYIEGYIVFPYAPAYKGDKISVEIIACTPVGDFTNYDTLLFGFPTQ